MLPRKQHISRHLFKLAGRGKVVFDSAFSMRIFLLPQKTEKSRFSMVISRKVWSSAVERNTLKRRGYAAVSKLASQVRDGYGIAFFFKKQAKECSTFDMQTHFSSLLRKAGALDSVSTKRQ